MVTGGNHAPEWWDAHTWNLTVRISDPMTLIIFKLLLVTWDVF